MNRMIKRMRLLLGVSIWNTLRLNFSVFPLRQACKIPVLVGRKVKMYGLRKGCILAPNRPFSIHMGICEGSFGLHAKTPSSISFPPPQSSEKFKELKNPVLHFKGRAFLQRNFHININGRLVIGDNFQSNTGMIVSVADRIEIGKDVLLGWNVTILDADGHSIMRGNSDKPTNTPRPVIIEDHCWLSANVSILKGVQVKEGTVIAYGSTVTKSSQASHIIIAQNGHVVANDIRWRH